MVSHNPGPHCYICMWIFQAKPSLSLLVYNVSRIFNRRTLLMAYLTLECPKGPCIKGWSHSFVLLGDGRVSKQWT